MEYVAPSGGFAGPGGEAGADPDVRTRVRVLLVDDRLVIREGLRLLLAGTDGIDVVATVSSPEEAVSAHVDPSVIVTEMIFRDRRGPEPVARLREAFRAPILVLAATENPVQVRAALGAGAAGFISKWASAEDVIAAVHTVAAGRSYVEPSMAGPVLQLDESDRIGSIWRLTPRQRDVVRLIARGYTNPEIARRLQVSVRTVEAHRAESMRRVGATTRAELVTLARRAGVVEGGE